MVGGWWPVIGYNQLPITDHRSPATNPMPATLTIEVTLDTRDIERAANDVRQKVAGAFNGAAGSNALQSGLAQAALKLKEIGRIATQAGKALTASVTLPVVGLGAAVIKVGFEFEKSMNDLRAATKASGDELARATKLAKDLGNDLSLPAISANDAASAMTTLAKAGLSLEQSMQAVKGTLQLASAAQIDAAKAAEIQSDAINTFKLAATDAGRVADLLAASANSTSGEITDVAFALKQTGAAAAVLKIPIEDTVTALGLLAQSGVRGSDAGTSLKTALIQLTNPTSKAKAAMEKLGLSFFDA